jgi:DNA-directed RNA polymerase sigma subunit (sigma70/sigma32)
MKKEKGIADGRNKRRDVGDDTLDSLRLYFQDIRAAQLLTPEEELELARRIAHKACRLRT